MSLAKKQSLNFSVRAVPHASKSEIVGEYGEALKIKIASPPIGDAADKELIVVLAKFVGVSPSAVEITSGAQTKTSQRCERESREITANLNFQILKCYILQAEIINLSLDQVS